MCGFVHNKGVEESYLLNLYVPMQYSAFLCFKCDICLFKCTPSKRDEKEEVASLAIGQFFDKLWD